MPLRIPQLDEAYIKELQEEYYGKPGTIARSLADGPLGRVAKKVIADMQELNKPIAPPAPPPPAPPSSQP